MLVGGVGPHSPQGILRAVESVVSDGGSTTVKTRPASLLHAFRRLKIEVRRQHLNQGEALFAVSTINPSISSTCRSGTHLVASSPM